MGPKIKSVVESGSKITPICQGRGTNKKSRFSTKISTETKLGYEENENDGPDDQRQRSGEQNVATVAKDE